MPAFSYHSILRASQRNLSEDEIDYVLLNGQLFHKAGAEIYFLRHKDIPASDRGSDRRRRLAGTAVILSKDGFTIITIWRNPRDGLKRIKHKPAYGWGNSLHN